jgi:prephenate dehydrogenase
MAIQITIVGLGQIGGSFGLALAEQKETIQRVGHDLNPDVAKKALKLGAIDRISINLPSAVREADIVLLALPLDQIRETLEIIASDLKEDVVVLDTAPIKKVVQSWVKELLPPKRHYVGLTPVLNPNYLLMPETGIDAARPDLFKQGLLCITAPPGTAAEAVKLASDLTQIVGAKNLFVDLLENDSLMVATHLLPQLISAALLNATVDQPGWYEGRKFAGRAYAQVTHPSAQFGEPKTVSSSSLSDRQDVLRMVDQVIAVLQAMRNEIDQEDSQALEERFERARQGRHLWWSQRQKADWDETPAPPQISTGSEVVGRLFGIRPRKKPTPK